MSRWPERGLWIYLVVALFVCFCITVYQRDQLDDRVKFLEGDNTRQQQLIRAQHRSLERWQAGEFNTTDEPK